MQRAELVFRQILIQPNVEMSFVISELIKQLQFDCKGCSWLQEISQELLVQIE